MKNLRDRIAVVTGASSGIGRAVALELAEQGCDLAICSFRHGEKLEQTGSEIRALGRRVLTRQLDIAEREAVESFAAQVQQEFGAVHLLINNAGVGLVAPIDEMGLEDFEWLMQINFWGVVYATQAFLPGLQRADEAHIANISSVWGLWGSPGQSAYSCSKFAVRGFTETLAQELYHSNVAVSLVLPGGVKTDIARNSRFGTKFGPVSNKQGAVDLFERVAMTSPERAAQIVVDAIRKRKRRVLVGADAWVFDLTQRLFPSAYQRLIPLLMRLADRFSALDPMK